MFQLKSISPPLILVILIAAMFAACSKPAATDTVASAPPANAAATQSDQSSGIEVEIITLQPIEGAITATGKVLVAEDRTASIGPVHEGRIVNLYAGQGTVVRKGQKLADLESADIDEAEADF